MYNPERPYISGDSLNSARTKLAQGSHEAVAAAHAELLDAFPVGVPENSSEKRHYIRWLHIMGDTYGCAGDFESAEILYNDALAASETMLEEGSKRDLYQALLHVSLAEVARITGRTPAKEHIYPHTRIANDALSLHRERWDWRAKLVRYFCTRTLALSDLTTDRGAAIFFLGQMDNMAHSYDLAEYLAHDDPAVDAAREYLEHRHAKPDLERINTFSPLSAHFPMPN